MNRTRTFEWLDPARVVHLARSMAGVDFLRSVCDKQIEAAPLGQCLNFQLVEVEVGRVVFAIKPAEYHYNPIGTVHGGVLATLCDSAMGATVHSTLQKGEAYTSLEIKVNFLRPVTVDSGMLRCEGKLISRGSRIAVVTAQLIDETGKLYAHASSTCLISAAEPARKE